ncbi:hypothetical protein IWQ56_005374, partial [Coemansia nantahalensis]
AARASQAGARPSFSSGRSCAAACRPPGCQPTATHACGSARSSSATSGPPRPTLPRTDTACPTSRSTASRQPARRRWSCTRSRHPN